MKPTTSSTATGSFMPASPSSVRASRRFSDEPRSIAKIAAPSVEATIDPSSSPCSSGKPNSHAAASPQIAAVISVPSSARLITGLRTGRISPKPAARPPSNTISASATTPTSRARR